MRLLRALVVLVLIASLSMNVLQWLKADRRRMQLKINDQVITQRVYHDWLEQHDGVQMQALMTRYYLIMQAAEKAGLKPDEAEVDQLVAEELEQKPEEALITRQQTWALDDLKQQKRMDLALVNLTTKDVKVTEDELKTYYEQTRPQWDTPTKFYVRVIQCVDKATADRAKQDLQQMVARTPETKDHGIPQKVVLDLNLLQQSYALPTPRVQLPFGDGKKVAFKPFGRESPDPTVRMVARLPLGGIAELPVPGANGRTVLILLEKRVEGKAGSLNDATVRKHVERALKMTRATNPQETLRNLWDAADIQTDPPALKTNIENILLPERWNQERRARADASQP